MTPGTEEGERSKVGGAEIGRNWPKLGGVKVGEAKSGRGKKWGLLVGSLVKSVLSSWCFFHPMVTGSPGV
jgi:hypothetical protein